MSDIIAPLLETLNAHPQLSGLITFVISAAESIAIIGTIVPGSITMTAIGVLAGAGIIPIGETIFWAILGAIVGDGVSYWIGHYFKNRLHRVWPFRNHPSVLRSGEVFFTKHGSMSVFIGRFVGPVRALVPLVAGMLGMPPLRFIIANIASAILWAPTYMLPGIILGTAALELPPDIAMHVIIVFILIFLFAMLCLWFIYKTLRMIHKQTDQLKNWIWRRLKKSRYFSVATIILRHHDEKRTHGQLRSAIYFIIAGTCFLSLSIYVKIKGAANMAVNDVVFHLFRGIRSETADSVMLAITLLGQKQIILPTVFVCVIWFIATKHRWTAINALALGVLAASGVYITKHLIQSPRPWGILESPETFSMPSGHTTLATTVYMGLAFLIARSFKPKHRWPIYLIAGTIAFAVGVSRLYLGAHWFTDVLAGWLLSFALLTVVIISFRHRVEKVINPLHLLLVSLASLTLIYSVYSYSHFSQLTSDYSQVEWPAREVTLREWWQNNNDIPAYRASLFGFPSQKINIEWAGNPDKIRESLTKEGWSKPPVRDWVSTIHRIADISSAEYLPLISPQYLDRKPILMLTRSIVINKQDKHLLVIRLWNANLTTDNGKTPILVGIVSVVPRSYSWIYYKNAGDVIIDPAIVFPNKTGAGEWQWKNFVLSIPTKKSLIKQDILLIRANQTIHKKK